LTRIWAERGERPRVVRQQQYTNGYIIGSVCSTQNTTEAIISPICNTEVIRCHLQQISRATKPGRFAVVVMDRAGWHTTNKLEGISNVAPIFLPPASPELNPIEQVWAWMKDHFLANRTYKDFDDIVDKTCQAWNSFSLRKDLLRSMCSPAWAKITT
jgi:hypothetical protein